MRVERAHRAGLRIGAEEARAVSKHMDTLAAHLRGAAMLGASAIAAAQKEYRWFSLGASTPGASTSAAHAARKIVRALLAGQSEIAITPQAILAARLAPLFPELASTALTLANALLPSAAAESPSPVRGTDARALEPVTAAHFGWSAARRFNQIK